MEQLVRHCQGNRQKPIGKLLKLLNHLFTLASIIQASRQKMTKEEKQTVKAGEVPKAWKDKPAKLSQKDRDARWIVKQSKAKGDEGAVDFGIPYFGYKNHLSCDRRFGFVSSMKLQ